MVEGTQREKRRWRIAARCEAARVRNSWAKVTGSSAVRRSGKASCAAELDELDDDELEELDDDELEELDDDELEELDDDELEELDDELDDGSKVDSVRTSAART
jgi:hypothetical protein